jgi:DNA-binding response OmpR family regulator
MNDPASSIPAVSHLQGPFQVLLIDDDLDIHASLRDAVRLDGIEMHCAANPAQALDIVSRERILVILLDLGLDGADGFLLLERLKSNPQSASVPVIILTASGRTEDKVRGFELGAVDYVTKPFDLSELRARV